MSWSLLFALSTLVLAGAAGFAWLAHYISSENASTVQSWREARHDDR